MKKIIALSIICFFGLASFAQSKSDKDHLVNKLNEIKSELKLSEKQELAIKQLVEKRKVEMGVIEDEALISKEAMKAEKMAKMKKRQESSDTFRKNLSEILNEEQLKKLNELMPERKENMNHKHEHDAKLKHDHQHKMGEPHTH